ncbi:MAG: nucleotide pyrophosphohydrolase [Muribaculaceae bacterium]|nr:nucleotide pyrophosphohydrolase [Muribaculaceae bacterium]
MTIEDAQRRVHEWIEGIGKGYFSELTNMALLTEEVGELARVMARTYGDQRPKKGETDSRTPREKMAEEMADVLWVLICLANQTGIDLTDALEASFRKKTLRDSGRWDI